MLKFSSLSQRLLFGYVSAITALIIFLTFLNQHDFSALVQFFASIFAITLVFIVLHLFFFRHFLTPVHHLIEVAKEQANNEQSQRRAVKANPDELGELTDTFNDMVNQLQLREEMIISERDRVAIALEQAADYARATENTNNKLAKEIAFREHIEGKLTQFQQFLNSIINSMPSALMTIDETLKVSQWNLEAAKLSGITSDNAIGQKIDSLLPLIEPHIDWIQQVWQTNATRTIHNLKQSIDEQTRHFDITIYPLLDTSECSAVIRVDDVTEKIKMEETIVQSDKVLSLGGMAAGMAHEINNPISAIIQNVQNIHRRIDPELDVNINQAEKSNIDLHALNRYLKERRIHSFLNNISQSGVRASKLVANMLQFSRASDLSLQPCLMVEVLEKAINIALTDDQLNDFKGNFSLNIDQDFQALDACVHGVFTELEQVFLNLIKNAAFAIKERRVSLNDIDEGVIQIHQHIENNQCIVSVRDNGMGMQAHTRKKIFEPFFTTKDVGAGTGLGLSVSYFIVSSHHNGQMQVESDYGRGTVFEISLPLT